jgi:uncharacterized protein YjbK
MDQEVEIKLDLGSFTNYLKLMGFLGQVDREVRQYNGFFDTEDHRLSQLGWALRIRAEDHRGLVTVKSTTSEVGDAFVRDEIEAEIPRSRAIDCLNLNTDVMGFDLEPIRFVREQLGPVPVAVLVKFDNLRQSKVFRFGDYDYTLEIDSTEFADGSVEYELEVELPDTGKVEVVTDSLRKMFSSLGIPYQGQTESKYYRALMKAGIK